MCLKKANIVVEEKVELKYRIIILILESCFAITERTSLYQLVLSHLICILSS